MSQRPSVTDAALAGAPALDPLLLVPGEAGHEGGVTGSLESNLHVIGMLLPVYLAPAVREQVLQAAGGRPTEPVGARNAQVEALVDDLAIVRHGPSVAGRSLAVPATGPLEAYRYRYGA